MRKAVTARGALECPISTACIAVLVPMSSNAGLLRQGACCCQCSRVSMGSFSRAMQGTPIDCVSLACIGKPLHAEHSFQLSRLDEACGSLASPAHYILSAPHIPGRRRPRLGLALLSCERCVVWPWLSATYTFGPWQSKVSSSVLSGSAPVRGVCRSAFLAISCGRAALSYEFGPRFLDGLQSGTKLYMHRCRL